MTRNYTSSDYVHLVDFVRSAKATQTPGFLAFRELFKRKGFRWPLGDAGDITGVSLAAIESGYAKLVSEHICLALIQQTYYVTWKGHPVGVHGSRNECFQFLHGEASITGQNAHELLEKTEWEMLPITEKNEHMSGTETTQFLLQIRSCREDKLTLVESIVVDRVSQCHADIAEIVDRITSKLPEPKRTMFSVHAIDHIRVDTPAKEEIKLLLGGDICRLLEYRTYAGSEFKSFKALSSTADAYGKQMQTESLGFAVTGFRYSKIGLLGRLFFDGQFHWLDLSASLDGAPEFPHELCKSVPVSGRVVRMFHQLANPLLA